MVTLTKRPPLSANQLRRRRRNAAGPSMCDKMLPCLLLSMILFYVGVTVWLVWNPPPQSLSTPDATKDSTFGIGGGDASSHRDEGNRFVRRESPPQDNGNQSKSASKPLSDHINRDIPHGGRMEAEEQVHGPKHPAGGGVEEEQTMAEQTTLKQKREGEKATQPDASKKRLPIKKDTALESYLADLDKRRQQKQQQDTEGKDATGDKKQQPLALEKMTDTTLRAYLEPIHQEDWEIKPLPVRNTTADMLKVVEYPRLKSCSKLMAQFPVDEFPNNDPFLPWIHDVFPTHNGKYIQFVAQNRRRCHTSKTPEGAEILTHAQPQIALFQHVPVHRFNDDKNTTRYRLVPHEDADEDGMETRFICRFKPTMEETLSVYNVNYEFATYRKGGKSTFTREGVKDIKSLHTSQLIFQCPVPPRLQELVKSGSSVVDDYATLFVDIIPIRTPPRYTRPDDFFPPRYKEHQQAPPTDFDAKVEWGSNHVLPLVENSGRWENIPICKPSLMEYEPTALESSDKEKEDLDEPVKNHRLIACVWASTGYTTRGERFAVNDGQRRLREWLTFNFLVGFDHIYVYDNSGAHPGNMESLQTVTDDFEPTKVTRVVWPSKVCNNRKNNVDSPGERSSQYAAEASCRLRFGPHAEWLGGFDIDEYLVPLGNNTSLNQILDTLEAEGNKIISFGSWRAWPRKAFIEEPETINDPKVCGRRKPCFHVRVPANNTLLQTYNCDRQRGQKTQVMPAEKQLYRPDYVLQHFVHFSTITTLSQMSKSETLAAGQQVFRQRISQDPACRFSNEINEGTMLHTKAIATQDTADWLSACRAGDNKATCRIGNPYPEGAYEADIHNDDKGWKYNCFVNQRIEDYWVPKLEQAMKNNSGLR